MQNTLGVYESLWWCYLLISFALPGHTPLQEWPDYNAVLKKHPAAFQKPPKAENKTAGRYMPAQTFNNLCFELFCTSWEMLGNVVIFGEIW